MTSLPSPAFGCEQQRRYSFSMHCKRSLHPTLTRQFQVTWPWPVRQHKGPSRVAGGSGDAQDMVSTSITPQGNVLKEEDEPGEEEEPEGEIANEGMSGSDACAAAYSSAPQLWRERRRYGRPTFILDFSSDPFLGGHETRRVAVLLSPGYRCLLPLIQLDEPEQLPDNAGVAFWRTAFKPPFPRTEPLSSSSYPSTAHPPPYCAEVLLGEVSGIEAAVRQRHAGTTASSRRHNARTLMKPSFLSRISLGLRTQLSAPGPAPEGEANVSTEGRDHPSPYAKHVGLPLPSAASASATDPGDEETVAASSPPRASSRSQQGSTFTPKRVLTFFFYTIPFRLRWLSQLPGCIVVSLPCEERLLTLHAPHAHDGHTSAPRPSPSLVPESDSATSTAILSMSQVHSYVLPRGVVPLDISEVFDRPFLAIGTAEHGVLLCHLDTATGAVQSIARWISLRGYGSSLYPVTRLAAVFPARQLERAPDRFTDSPSAPPWVRHVTALESLSDGVLVCSSPYEATATVVKLGVAAEGVVEDFSVLRGVDTILDVSAAVQPDVGPLVCTVSRKLLWLRVIHSASEEAERRNAILKKKLDAALADRVSPCLTHNRMLRLECPLLHVASSPAVVQSFTDKYVSRRSYTKHWQLAVDNWNRVVLLDRTVSQYIVHSTFQLGRQGSAAEEGRVAPVSSLPPVSDTTYRPVERQARPPCCAGRPDDVLRKSCEAAADGSNDTLPLSPLPSTQPSPAPTRGQKRTRPAPNTAANKRTPVPTAERRGAFVAPSFVAATVKAERNEDEEDASTGKANSFYVFASAIPSEDACSGVVVTRAQDEIIQVAAAHDRDCISLVTWHIGRATPPPPPLTSSAAVTAITVVSASNGKADAQSERRGDVEG
ncbi:hypothetical protein, conserved [Leishmania tarentolae]|uniref:Uncharacterized protein n=1 Tax=Leishmania tarentolae TaxID=5689 RepID=A0A640KEE0_LEITA|nr:hypothetical protein, conserved [Leishmania tarentolae]